MGRAILIISVFFVAFAGRNASNVLTLNYCEPHLLPLFFKLTSGLVRPAGRCVDIVVVSQYRKYQYRCVHLFLPWVLIARLQVVSTGHGREGESGNLTPNAAINIGDLVYVKDPYGIGEPLCTVTFWPLAYLFTTVLLFDVSTWNLLKIRLTLRIWCGPLQSECSPCALSVTCPSSWAYH